MISDVIGVSVGNVGVIKVPVASFTTNEFGNKGAVE
jgi:hypothetical protein